MSASSSPRKLPSEQGDAGDGESGFERGGRWVEARRRYAAVWQQSVLQDWFSLFIYPSESERVREIDVAGEQPELARTIAGLSGRTPDEQDLLIGLGERMGAEDLPNDPETWAAIDIGEFVALTHFATGDGRMGWQQRNLLTCAAATVALHACPGLSGILSGASELVEVHGDEGPSMPKSALLAQYLVWVAASECYREEGSATDPKVMTARFCEEHELMWSTINGMTSIAYGWSADRLRGPLTSIEIAGLAAELLSEAYRRTVVPQIARNPTRRRRVSGKAA